MELYDVVTKLVGPIHPVGDSRIDDDRYNNLNEMLALVDRLLGDIDAVASCKHRIEASMNKAGKRADNFLTQILTQIGVEE